MNTIEPLKTYNFIRDVPLDIALNNRLSGNAVRLYLYLRFRADVRGSEKKCLPVNISNKFLADKLELCEGKIYKLLNQLVEEKFITCIVKATHGNGWRKDRHITILRQH